jgi:hypothetical protein
VATNSEVIGDALRELGVIAETETPSAEQGTHGLRKMNDLLEAWTEYGIELGYFAQSATSDTCPVPNWALRAVKLCLAPEIATAYGAKVSPELAVKIDDAYQALLRKTQVEALPEASMDHMPQGSGKFGTGFDIISG